MGIKPENESGLMRACVQLLALRGWLVLRFNPSLHNYGGQWVRHCPEGMSDLLIARKGVVAFVELKMPKGRIRPSQRQFCDTVRAAGCNYFIARSVEQLAAFLDELDS